VVWGVASWPLAYSDIDKLTTKHTIINKNNSYTFEVSLNMHAIYEETNNKYTSRFYPHGVQSQSTNRNYYIG
jgi:hypothetical protein